MYRAVLFFSVFVSCVGRGSIVPSAFRPDRAASQSPSPGAGRRRAVRLLVALHAGDPRVDVAARATWLNSDAESLHVIVKKNRLGSTGRHGE
jgi:hypothetical protein